MVSPDEPTPTEGEPTETPPIEGETPPEEAAAETPEADAEAQEGDTEGENETPEGETEAKQEENSEEPEKRKRAGGWQRRIERQERQIAQQAEIIERLSRQMPAGPAQTPTPQTPEEKSLALLRAAVKQTMAEEAEQQRQQTAILEFQRRTAEVRAKRADFDDVISHVDIHPASAIGQALLTSEHSGEILYQLGANPSELARIRALPEIAQVREIGRLEAKFASVAPPARTNGTAKRPPAPPTQVNGSKAPSAKSLENLDIRAYKRAMRSGGR